MMIFKRREFLSLFPCAFLGTAFIPLKSFAQDYKDKGVKNQTCWLDVCAPFIVEDSEIGIHSEIVLTSDTFVGTKGYEDGADVTEYEIYLYDAEGKAIGADGVAKRLTVPAMQTTVFSLHEILGENKNFFGGMKIRLRPKGRMPMHASDLFSSAFVRWTSENSFDNVHANPDPLQWQKADSFFYSMPFPHLKDYDCVFSLFNPYNEQGKGAITLYDSQGKKLKEVSYDLKPHASLLLDLSKGGFVNDAKEAFGGSFSPRSGKEKVARRETSGTDCDEISALKTWTEFPCAPSERESNLLDTRRFTSGYLLTAPSAQIANTNQKNHADKKTLTSDGGTIAITNQQGAVKNFGYLLIKQKNHPRFSIDHPIHQPPFNPVKANIPFDAEGKFKAKNILYTPLLFRSKQIGGVTLESRFHFSSGLPVEEFMWLSPFITDAEGNVAWQITNETKLPASIPSSQIERGVIKLGVTQSCIFDCSQTSLPKFFSGGLSLAVTPNTNHTLMKVEMLVKEWDAHAFTHFRPGIYNARSYQKPKQRGGLATDYIASGARFERNGNKISRDEIVGVMNIDGVPGIPTLEIFTSRGLLTRIKLGAVAGFACRHYLLSELLSGKIAPNDLSLRLVDEQATLLMSVLHLDYVRRDIAMDHGSDRFSTFTDFNCDA